MNDRDERDQEIATLIQTEITKVWITAKQCGYERGSANDAYLQGQIVGLRAALRLVHPDPHRVPRPSHGPQHQQNG